MANSSSVGFGLKPIKMYGNGYENMGLGEYPVQDPLTLSTTKTWFVSIRQDL